VLRHRQKKEADKKKKGRVVTKAATIPMENRVKVDTSKGLVYKDSGQEKLTATEVDLLKYLIANEGKNMSSEDILTKIWGIEYADATSHLQQYINHLREKLEDNPNIPEIIVQEEDGYKIAHNAIEYI